MLSFVRRNGWLIVACFTAIGSVYSSVRLRLAATTEGVGQTAPASLACEMPSHDFGIVPQLETLTASFRLTNKSQVGLHIQNVRSECGCTATQLHNKELQPGESTVLSVLLRTDFMSGAVRKRVWVDHSPLEHTEQNETLTLTIEATVSPDYRAEPSSILLTRGEIQQRELRIVPVFESRVKVKNAESNAEAIVVDLVEPDRDEVEDFSPRLRLIFDSTKWEANRHTAIITVATDSKRQPTLNIPVSVR